MAKEFFKALPDTSTPLSPERLNGLLNGNEALGSIVVGDVECKNLFDIQQAQTTNSIIKSLTRDSIVFSDNGDVYSQLIYKLVLKKNTIYTLKYTFETTNPNFNPFVDIQGNGSWENSLGNGSTGTNVITFNSGNWDYVNISFPIGGATNITNTGTLSNVQLEKGSEATEYVPYKDFEGKTNIITGQECPTNEYIDGKQVYVKRVNFGNLANANKTTVAHGLTNFVPVRINGVAKMDNYYIHLPFASTTLASNIALGISSTEIEITTGSDRSLWTAVIDIYYTKN